MKAPDNNFARFDWQIEGRKPSQVSSLPAGRSNSAA